jgi:hypothetical protein
MFPNQKTEKTEEKKPARFEIKKDIKIPITDPKVLTTFNLVLVL